MADYHKLHGNFQRAVYYLGKSVAICEREKKWKSLAQASANISAVYAKMQRHKECVSHAKRAIKVLKNIAAWEENPETLVCAVVSHYNLGAAQEALGRFTSS
jgi:hypothetical protein